MYRDVLHRTVPTPDDMILIISKAGILMQADIKTINRLCVLALTCAAFKEIAAAKTISLLTAAGFTFQDVAAPFATLPRMSLLDFRLPDNPRSCLQFKTSKAAGVIEVKKFGVTFRGIIEEPHCYTVRLPQHPARSITHPALHHEYSPAVLITTKPIPRRCPPHSNMCSASTP
jgi:hypothetical protein